MLKSLLEIIDTGEFEDNGSLCIEEALTHQDDLLVRLRLKHPDGGTEHRTILCHQPRSHFLQAAEYFDDLSVCDDHVLLWPHSQLQAALYFNGRPDNAHALLGALVETHHRTLNDWFPITRFMNNSLFSPNVELLASGSGLLAEGPFGIIDAYASVLETFNIRHSSPPRRPPSWWDGTRWQPETEKLYALIMGSSYVVGPNFTENTA
ncbi:MAG: hypothetical protein KF851_01690 [Pirellulaceae bacterium]|nr:hypothetical protein [Pirellulaceae bacterium]